MQTILLTIKYNGKPYAGWQRQDGFDTIQERLEDACATLFGERIAVHGAGRTDAGVHALRQTAHVRIPRDFPLDQLSGALNGNLPRDIVVRGCRAVPPGFHARFSARGKRYVYRFLNQPERPVLLGDLFHWVRRPMDIALMRDGAAHLVGEHDFAAFASNPGYERTRGTVRHITQSRIVRRPHGMDLVFQGSGFLYNMVRAIAGTLQDVGTERIPPDRVLEILNSRDRSQAGMTAPSRGLYLLRVLYSPDDLEMSR